MTGGVGGSCGNRPAPVNRHLAGNGASDAGRPEDPYCRASLIHRLPRARVVDRIAWLTERCRGKRVIHVGFADAGFRTEQQRAGRWLHQCLGDAAAELVGIDTDPAGVGAAAESGYEAHLADCADPAEVAALQLAPADVVVAGEVIEHIDAPGPFVAALRGLCRSNGRLIVTTPNACGLVNPVAGLLRGVEVNHPDHVVMFTQRTLCELLRRRGWRVVETACYVPPAGPDDGGQGRLGSLGVRAVLGLERLLGRLGRPFAADGLIVVAAPAA